MQIQWTKNASQHLKYVEEYIAQDKPIAAIDTVLRLIEAVELLIEHPAMGRPGRVINTRELVITGTPYIIPYRIKNHQIQILSVLHGAMQWPENF